MLTSQLIPQISNADQNTMEQVSIIQILDCETNTVIAEYDIIDADVVRLSDGCRLIRTAPCCKRTTS